MGSVPPRGAGGDFFSSGLELAQDGNYNIHPTNTEAARANPKELPKQRQTAEATRTRSLHNAVLGMLVYMCICACLQTSNTARVSREQIRHLRKQVVVELRLRSAGLPILGLREGRDQFFRHHR